MIKTKKGLFKAEPVLKTGTSAQAAQTLNRSYIGYEINEEYVTSAKRKLLQSELDLDNTEKNQD